jgi:hypothetical protein
MAFYDLRQAKNLRYSMECISPHRDFSYHPEGKFAAVVCENGQNESYLRIEQITDEGARPIGEGIYMFMPEYTDIRRVLFSPDGLHIAVVTSGGGIWLLSAERSDFF